MVSKDALLQSETTPSSGNTLTLTLIVFMPQIACKEMRNPHPHKGNMYDTFVYHNYTIDYQRRQ